MLSLLFAPGLTARLAPASPRQPLAFAQPVVQLASNAAQVKYKATPDSDELQARRLTPCASAVLHQRRRNMPIAPSLYASTHRIARFSHSPLQTSISSPIYGVAVLSKGQHYRRRAVTAGSYISLGLLKTEASAAAAFYSARLSAHVLTRNKASGSAECAPASPARRLRRSSGATRSSSSWSSAAPWASTRRSSRRAAP